MKKIFISGPYTLGDVAVNVKNSMDAANSLIEMDMAPFCPHLTHYLHINNPQPYEIWLKIDIAYLEICDGVLRLAGKSKGADAEVKRAKQLKIPVFYSINEVKKHFKK